MVAGSRFVQQNTGGCQDQDEIRRNNICVRDCADGDAIFQRIEFVLEVRLCLGLCVGAGLTEHTSAWSDKHCHSHTWSVRFSCVHAFSCGPFAFIRRWFMQA